MKRNRKSTQGNLLDRLIDGGLISTIMTVLMIRTMLEDIAGNMVKSLQQVIGSQGMEDQPIDEDYANRLGAAIYFVSIAIPFEILRDQMGGVINAAWNYIHDYPDDCSPATVTELVRDGFKDISPSMAAVVTEDIIIKAGKLMLWDWMHMNGEPTDEAMFDYDRQFYFHELIRMEASPDEDAIRNEGYKHLMNMSEDERAGLDPELFEIAEKWAEQEGIDKAE